MRTRTANLPILALCLVALAACGPTRSSRGNSGGGANSGGGGTPGGGGGDAAEVARPDAALYVEGDTNQAELKVNGAEIQSISTEGNRAMIQVSNLSLKRNETVTITARPLGDFNNPPDIINGIYDFQPNDLDLKGPVTIFLPLNDLPVTRPEQLQLVRWASAGEGWTDVEVAVTIIPGDQGTARAEVTQLGIYGLRVVGGFGALNAPADVEDGPGDIINGVECPGSRDDFAIGPQVGQRFPDVNMRNADGVGESLYNLCGNKAILLVSSAFWCGSCRAEFQHLLNLAPTWKERGGAIYYTMFENADRQPPSDAELAAWESDATPASGERLFRVLKDPRMISSLYRDVYGSLPFNAVFDGQMVVTWFKPGAALPEVISEMERLMD